MVQKATGSATESEWRGANGEKRALGSRFPQKFSAVEKSIYGISMLNLPRLASDWLTQKSGGDAQGEGQRPETKAYDRANYVPKTAGRMWASSHLMVLSLR